MRIPILIISAASFAMLGGIAQADDHLFQAQLPGHGLDNNLNSQALEHGDEAPGRGSPFTAFEKEDLGIPSTAQPQADHEQELPSNAGPKK
jgi:hypothetical protein